MTTVASPVVSDAVAPGAVSPARWRWPDIVLLLVVLAIACVVQSVYIQPNPSFDELWHLMLSTGRGTPVGFFTPDQLFEARERLTSLVGAPPAWRVWIGLDGMPHPPLYFVLLRLWRDVVGESDRAGNAFSIACSLVGVGFTYAAGRLAMNRWTAALAALALGCAQTQVYFAQEMRPYALATAIAAIALWLMTRIELLGPTRAAAIALAALTLPLMLTHYFTVGACMAIAAYGFARLRGRRTAFALTLAAAAVVFAIAWLPFALRQARDVGPAASYLHTEHVDVLREVALLACAPFRLIADREYFVERLGLLTGVLFVLPWFLTRRLHALWPWCAMLCGGIVPVFLVDVLASRTHLEVIRYSAVASPAVVLLFIGCAWAVRRRLAYLTGATVLAAGLIYLVSRNPIFGECPDFAGSIAIVEREAAPGDAILFYSGAAPDFYADMLALTATHSKTLLPRPMMVVRQPVAPDLLSKLPNRVWILSGRLEHPVGELIPGAKVVSSRVADIEVLVTLVELRSRKPHD
jgi:hypothetical protein